LHQTQHLISETQEQLHCHKSFAPQITDNSKLRKANSPSGPPHTDTKPLHILLETADNMSDVTVSNKTVADEQNVTTRWIGSSDIPTTRAKAPTGWVKTILK